MICSASLCDTAIMSDDRFATPEGRLTWAREQAGFGDKAKFANAVGINEVTYRAYESGQNGFAKHAAAFAKKLGVTAEWLLEGGPLPTPKSAPETARVVPDQPRTRSVDGGEAASVARLDLSYAMGPGTDLDAAYIEEESVALDIALLRRLTPSPPNRLRIVNGIGDSMFPTIHDREELILDLNQTMLNMQDRIWAISLYGAGALKRLRTIGRNRILVISDNPGVPDQEVSAEDIRIVGRLVGSIKRY